MATRLVDIFGTEVSSRRRLSPSLSHPIVESVQHIISPLSMALLSWGIGRTAVMPHVRTFFAARRAVRMRPSSTPPPPPPPSQPARAAPIRKTETKFRSRGMQHRSFSTSVTPPPPSSIRHALPDHSVERFADYWDSSSYVDVLHHLSSLWLPVKIESLLMQLHETTGFSW